LTARLLLIFALLWNLAPIALAAAAPPPHACCLRKGMQHHHCHDFEAKYPTFTDRSCCRPDRSQAPTVTQTAHAQPGATIPLADGNENHSIQLRVCRPAAERFALSSSRAPPEFLLA
jgi:hypothetical protein